MKGLDELFESAKNAPSPLPLNEAKDLIQLTKTGTTSVSSPSIIIGSSAIILISLVSIIIWSNNSQLEINASDSSVPTYDDSYSGIRNEVDQIIPIQALPQTAKPILNSATPFEDFNQENEILALDLNKTHSSHAAQHLGSISTIDYPEQIDSLNPLTNSVEAAGQPEDLIPKSIELPTVFAAESMTGETQIATESMTEDTLLVQKLAPKPLSIIHSIKTDLLGYFYPSLMQEVFFKTQYIDTKPLTGVKMSLSYERSIGRRFSAGISVNYGFAPYSRSAVYKHDSIIEERFTNYQGISFNLQGRYYFAPQKLTYGPYAGISLNGGSFEERTFLGRKKSLSQNPIETQTLNLNKGKSWGLGLNAGYKLPIWHFFVEPNLGVIFWGSDKDYRKWVYQGQSSQPRYRTLYQFELNIGYSF